MARILHVLPAFLPATAWGGPVVSTAAMCRAAARHHQLEVLTTDSADPETGARLTRAQTRQRVADGYDVTYARRAFGQSGSWEMLARLPRKIAAADLVHLSMTYSFPTLPVLFLCRLLGTPVVWSPRGAIQATEDWPDAPRKRLKTAFEAVARRLLPRRTVLHLTAEAEAIATARRIPGVRTEVIANPVTIPRSAGRRQRRPDGRLRLLFLSRLHPKKGLESLFDALVMLPDHVTLTVCGQGAGAYEAALAARVAALGLGRRVRFAGHVDGAAKARAMAAADVFVLPTQSENFGIAIAEALAAELPVITTRAAPWADIEARGCGMWIDQGAEPLAAAIRGFDACTASDLDAMGQRGRAWMQSTYGEEVVGARLLALYDQILGTGTARAPRPAPISGPAELRGRG